MASASLSEEQSQEQQQQTVKEKESVYKTKIVQFLGRTTPIILQNDNGPCPLLAICNILLLRNNLNLAPDTTEVSQEKLLSLVAERLIDSNSNVNNKDAGYVENQEQNISDAIDLLPRLATGIDVNIKFRSVADFEFTPECAIFDLLDIPLYHGWIVDPQDHDTASAIGSKSYNALTGELVALETQNPQSESKTNPEEDCIDFAAATTATLGVPSPCLSKNRSFDDSPMSHSDEQKVGKGDLQEEAELLKALKLSETESPTSDGNPCLPNVEQGSTLINLDESTSSEKDDFLVKNVSHQDDTIHQLDLSTPDVRKTSDNGNTDISALETNSGKLGSGKFGSSFSNADLPLDQSLMKTEEHDLYHRVVEKSSGDSLVGTTPHMEWSSVNANFIDTSQGVDKIQNSAALTMNDHEPETKTNGDITIESSLSSLNVDSDTSNRRIDHTDGTEALSPSVDVSEPIYEGEECILDAETKTFADREPVYEGEVVLAEQADRSTSDSDNGNAKDEITPKQGELIRNFLKNNASQLTIYGLFCLQEGLKERELCVFFRNNHFSTMFKFDGQLYLLATDQGYINQPDLVWEKLNEVNGDSSFMTGNFKEFKVESQANDTWDQHNAMTSTADYLASIDSATQAGFDMNSDLQLAIALQQQEFEQQSSPRHNVQQQSLSSTSGLITGPHVPKNSGRNPSSSSSSSSARAEAAKQKEKCSLM